MIGVEDVIEVVHDLSCHPLCIASITR